MTLDNWNDNARKEWTSTWKTKRMREGLLVLKDTARTMGMQPGQRGATMVAGLDPLAAGAILNAFREGANAIIAVIEEDMVYREKPPKPETEKAYGGVESEDE